MQFHLTRGQALHEQATVRPLSETELLEYQKFSRLMGRISIYGIPLVMALWIYLAFPNLFPNNAHHFSFVVKVFGLVLLCPFLHELIHLLALPHRAFAPATQVFVRLDGIRSNMAVRVAGPIKREQAIWIALLPFLMLTVLPFALLLQGWQLDLAIGLAAAINFGLSTQDIGQAVACLLHYRKGQLHYP